MPISLKANIGFASALFFAACVTVLTYLYLRGHPGCCDAVSYAELAAAYQAEGLLTKHFMSGIRTYAYPLFLASIQSRETLAGELSGLHDVRVPIFQFLIFSGAAFTLIKALTELGAGAVFAATFGIFGNIFVLVFISHRLGEALSIACLFAVTACIVRDRAWSLVLAAFIAGLAIMIRPANFPIALGLCAVFLFRLAMVRDWRTVALAAFALALPVVPQVWINWNVHDIFTLWPAVSLGNQQIVWGVENAKYATNLSGGPAPMFYPNPFFAQGAHSILFYVAGVGTATLHIFNSVTVDYLFPYVHDLRPWYAVPMLIANHGLVFLAAATALRLLRGRAVKVALGLQDQWWIFLLIFVCATCGLNAIVAVESRFGLPVLAVLGPLAVYGASMRWRTWVAIPGLVYVFLAVCLALWQREAAIAALSS